MDRRKKHQTRRKMNATKKNTAQRTAIGSTPGSGNHKDPDWLLENISLDQIEAMLAAVTPTATAHLRTDLQGLPRRVGTGLIFTDWEANLAVSLNEQYDTKTLRGYYDHPLSGKQLFWLYKFYEKIGADTAEALVRGEDNG
jgi:hypothetical protein